MKGQNCLSREEWVAELKEKINGAEKTARKAKRRLTIAITAGPALIFFFLCLALGSLIATNELSTKSVIILFAVLVAKILILFPLFLGLRLHHRFVGRPGVRSAIFALGAVCVEFAFNYLMGAALVLVGEFNPDDLNAGDARTARVLRHLAGLEASSMLLTLMSLIIFIHFVLRKRLQFFEHGRTTGAYIQIPPTSGQTLWIAIREIQEKAKALLQLEMSFSVWLNRSPKEKLPNVYTTRNQHGENEYCLVVPRIFIQSIPNSPEITKAILAHEMAHIYQNDARQWSAVDIYSVVMARSVIALYMAVLLLGMLAATFFGGEAPRQGLVLTLFTAVICWAYATAVRARKESELLADSFAVETVGADAISAAVREHASNKSPLHPSPRERLANIEAQREKFGGTGRSLQAGAEA